MTTTTIYPISGYPTVTLDADGMQITIRPMLPEDGDALLEFFRRVPEQDRFYLKEDVMSAKVIDKWTKTLDYGRVLPLLALADGKIIADATLHHFCPGARQHIGEVRVVVDREYRNKGIGRGLLHKVIELAHDKKIRTLMFEIVPDAEGAAMTTAKIIGFKAAAVLRDHVMDIDGHMHDMVLMELNVVDALPEAPDVF